MNFQGMNAEAAGGCFSRYQSKLAGATLFILYNAYLAYAIYYHITVAQKAQWDFCEGLGFLLILTALFYIGKFSDNSTLMFLPK